MGNYLHREYNSIFYPWNIVLELLNRIPSHPPVFSSLVIPAKKLETTYTDNIIRYFSKEYCSGNPELDTLTHNEINVSNCGNINARRVK